MKRALPVLLLLALPACRTAGPVLTATGESLAAIGESFAVTGEVMDLALDTGTVTPGQYRAWATFAKRFRLVYPVAADTWQAAVEANDGTAAQHAAAIIAQLGADLAPFVELVTQKEQAP